MKRWIPSVVLGMATVLVVAACGSNPTAPTHHQPFGSVAAPPIPIFGRWSVVSIGTNAFHSSSSIPGHPYIQFDRDGTVHGFDAVNHFEGTFGFTMRGQGLQLTDVRSTLIGLGGPVPTALTLTQAAFATMTSGTTIRYLINHQRLILYCGHLSLVTIHG